VGACDSSGRYAVLLIRGATEQDRLAFGLLTKAIRPGIGDPDADEFQAGRLPGRAIALKLVVLLSGRPGHFF
jgi:hypothetical protein